MDRPVLNLLIRLLLFFISGSDWGCLDCGECHVSAVLGFTFEDLLHVVRLKGSLIAAHAHFEGEVESGHCLR